MDEEANDKAIAAVTQLQGDIDSARSLVKELVYELQRFIFLYFDDGQTYKCQECERTMSVIIKKGHIHTCQVGNVIQRVEREIEKWQTPNK